MGCFEDLLGEDIRVALNAVLRINCREPEFEWNHGEGETGQKLASRQARAFAEWATSTHLSAWLDQHPIAAMKLLEQSAVAASARVGRRAEWDLWRSLGI
jgi:DNA gyrase subunit B